MNRLLPELHFASVQRSYVEPSEENALLAAMGVGRQAYPSVMRSFSQPSYTPQQSYTPAAQQMPEQAPAQTSSGTAPIINALFGVESSSSLDDPNWAIRGPRVPSGMYAGERAIGPAQIMPGNIPSWSQEFLGRQLDANALADGLASGDPQARRDYMAIVEGKVSSLQSQGYSPIEIASIWHSGSPRDRGAVDLATGIPTHGSGDSYITRFSRRLGGS